MFEGGCPLAVGRQLVSTLMVPHVEQTLFQPEGCA